MPEKLTLDEGIKAIKVIEPSCGYNNLLLKYVSWSGTSFFAVFIAVSIDQFTGGTYYTDGINEAVSGKFWNLVAISGLLFFGFAITALYLSQRLPWITKTAIFLRKTTNTVCMRAFEVGALGLGILTARLFIEIGNTYLLMWQSVLFGLIGVNLLLVLLLFNSLIWWVAESIYEKNTGGYSNLFNKAMQLPTLYALFGCLVYTAIVISVILTQK